MKVGQVMSEKVCSITSGRSVRYAADLMNELGIGSLVVIDEGEVKGIITSKDIRSAHPNRIVADAMTYNPVGVSQSAFIGSALLTMEQHKVERLIVQDGKQVKGIVTRETLKSTLGNYIDPLTNLYRSNYIEYIHEYLVEEGTPFYLLFIDLNDFGRVNKTYGHAVGDDLLIHFSGMLKQVVRDQDYLCRYGGDEFVIITSRSREEINFMTERLSMPVTFHSFTISAAIGVVYGYADNGQARTYRDCISTASLLSTDAKQKQKVQ
ncbi:Response regulator PleD [Paenibacillus konkukensis]|uniref:Response regulator PleD n=1 Tax=Paenibacillus konkukensis TaxID=2020716 RepID=A0ABY4RVH3_9BACL|nr:GGDEF domain-containing protein [Paenibacillus konkukensis]UQZ86337.1 Response regulator PleD [Paenibacillus konkukensis]